MPGGADQSLADTIGMEVEVHHAAPEKTECHSKLIGPLYHHWYCIAESRSIGVRLTLPIFNLLVDSPSVK
jgi:hypothetical protein